MMWNYISWASLQASQPLCRAVGTLLHPIHGSDVWGDLLNLSFPPTCWREVAWPTNPIFLMFLRERFYEKHFTQRVDGLLANVGRRHLTRWRLNRMKSAPALRPLNRGNCAEKVLDYNTSLFWVSSLRGHLQCVSCTECLFHTINSVYIHAYRYLQVHKQAHIDTYECLCACTHTNPSIHPPSILFPPQSTWPTPFFILHSNSQACIDSSIFIFFFF